MLTRILIKLVFLQYLASQVTNFKNSYKKSKTLKKRGNKVVNLFVNKSQQIELLIITRVEDNDEIKNKTTITT